MTTKEDIQIADIEKELSKLWDQQKGTNRIRASLFNLIAFTSEQRRANYLRAIVQSTVERFPCRILFVQGNKDPEANYVRVSVSNEVIGSGEASIACDQIFIDVSHQQTHRVPFIVLPNLVPDLPVFLLWGQDPTEENDILLDFLPVTSRLIFDSECADTISQFSKDLLELMHSYPNINFVDLNWVRISPWRNIIRQVFDSPETLKRLQSNQGIKITYCHKPTTSFHNQEIQALYLTAWMASQLRWKWISQEKNNQMRCLTFAHGHNEFQVTLSPESHQDLNPGAILNFDLLSNDEFSASISCAGNFTKAMVHISYEDSCLLPFTFPLQGVKSGFPFITDLMFSRTNSHYRHMLHEIQKIEGGKK